VSDLIQLYATANIRIAELERENAALREDKARLDWLEKHGATPICSRAAIDAARNKGPSWGDDQIMGQHLNNGGTPT
jgi:hypothetical protein